MRSGDYLYEFLAHGAVDLSAQERKLDDFEMFQLRHSDRYIAIRTEDEKGLACSLVHIALDLGIEMADAIDELPDGELTRQTYLETLVRLAMRSAKEAEENSPCDTAFSDAIAAIADIGWYMAARGRQTAPAA